MKILLAHNFYGSSAPSGENTVFQAERDLLIQAGHELIEYTRSSDTIREIGIIGNLIGAASTPWNQFCLRQVKSMLERERPDVMHVHNTFPLLSPAIFHAARGLGTATVLTLHNYRLFCAAGIPMRDSRPCTDCLDRRSAMSALRYGCYRNSRLATLPLAVMIGLHRGLATWQKHVDAFIALTEFQRGQIVAAGLPGERVSIKPHFLADPPSPVPWENRDMRAVYVGRLGEEKGIKNLLLAWSQWGQGAPHLDIIGSGPLAGELRNMVAQTGLANTVSFLGQLPFVETKQRMAAARLLLLPSLWFEGFPMVIREAFALGVPVAASRLGSMPCIVNHGHDGIMFTPGDPADLRHAVQALWQNQPLLAAMARNARGEFEKKYTATANYATLMEIYDKAIRYRQHPSK